VVVKLSVQLGDDRRRCGGCTLCCKLLPVRELQKKANTRCEHQSRKGCAIYHQLGFPPSCALWNCAWFGGDKDLVRPDRCGWVVDVMPDMIRHHNKETGEIQEIEAVQVWVESGLDLTHDPRLRRFAERCAARNAVVLLRYGSQAATAVFPPAMCSDGEWHFVGRELMTILPESRTGNLLLDRMKEEADAQA